MAIDRITTGAVLDGAIQTADIANLAVDDTKLKAGAVTAEKMAPGAAFVTGMIMPYAGAVANQAAAPSGWLLCDGSEQDATTYADLKNLLLTTYGPYSNGSGGTGTTHFRIPDLRGRVIAALNNMGGGDGTGGSRVTSPEGDQLGGILGAEEHKLTAAQSGMPGHTVSSTLNITSATARGALSGQSGSGGFQTADQAYANVAWVNVAGSASGTVAAQEAAQFHPLLQPTMFMNYIIKT
tara:strand:+ start:3935 stop:4648 length:714 start_codon:yes stop_codon:yes gene_type:complete